MSDNEISNVLEGIESGKLAVVEPQPRLRSWVVWLSFFGALWTILSALGLPQKWGIEEGTFKTILDAVGTILIGFGILNDPTNKANF